MPGAPIHPDLFTLPGDRRGTRLLAGRCGACRELHFPAGATCPYCASAGCAVEAVGASGTLSLFTVVTARPPGYRGPVPYGFGIVDLPEGLRVVTRLAEARLESLRTGLAVRLDVAPLFTNDAGDEVLSWAYAPCAEAPRAAAGGAQPPNPRAAAASSPGAPPRPVGAASARPVYITGVGIHPFGRFPDEDVTQLGQAAVREALAEASVGRGGFEAAFCGTVYSGVAAGHKVLSGLGLSGVPIVNLEAGCASGGAALSLGAAAIASGQRDRVLVFGMEKMPRGLIRSSFFPPWCEEAGLSPAPAYFALRARRLMGESGVTREHLARVSVKNHANGVHNPYAMYRKPFTIEEVLASQVVCDPLTLFMLCSPNEGAAAVVLSSRPGPVGPPLRVLAAVLRSHLTGSVLGEHTPLSGLMGPDPPSPTGLAAHEAYEAAGVGPEDLDLVELQDTDSGREILSLEELGLCPRGGGSRFVADGTGERAGRLPVNPSGGLLSKGEPLGASALGQVVELVWQLRGAAGPRQVPGAKLALGHTVGRGANASVAILAR